MTSPEDLVVSLRAAVAAAPNDVPLRLHLVDLLSGTDATDEAIHHAAAALLTHPDDANAREAMLRLLDGTKAGAGAGSVGRDGASATARGLAESSRPAPILIGRPLGLGRPPTAAAVTAQPPVPPPPVAPEPAPPEPAAEPPTPTLAPRSERSSGTWSIEGVDVTLDDVSGTQDALARVEDALLGPLHSRDQARLPGHELVHGALAYGPPGCGKGLIVRAVAMQLEAEFLEVAMGEVERGHIDLSAVFAECRGGGLTMLHLDRLDDLGHRDDVVEPLVAELDRGQTLGDRLLVVATTSRPWQVDARLLRPGRLSRAILVMPPGLVARRSILEREVRAVGAPELPVTEVALHANGYSGRDLVELVRASADLHASEAAATGVERPWTAEDLLAAMQQVPPSTARWFDRAEELLDVGAGSIFTGLGAYLRAREEQAPSELGTDREAREV